VKTITSRAINSALRAAGLGVEIVNNRDGYSYFLDRDGNQVGESVYICYLNQQTICEWVEHARYAVKQGGVA
jgi:hypothetical protein